MRDSYAKFVALGIKLYAVSYDDQEALRQFAREQHIPFPLLSDVDSRVIRQYGILNTAISKYDTFLYGIPFPGAYVTDANGIVIAKFFHDSHNKRDSAETLIDAAMGRVFLDDDEPAAHCGSQDIQVTATLHGGKGRIRQGLIRQVVVRFELSENLHIYASTAPPGMVATRVDVSGPPGLVVLDPILPPTQTVSVASAKKDLKVWRGTVDIVIPVYATSELFSEVTPPDVGSTRLKIDVRFQACTDRECLLPQTRTLYLEPTLEATDAPRLGTLNSRGEREGSYDSMPAMRRLLWRKVKNHPLGLLIFTWKLVRLKLASKRHSQ